MSNVWIIVDVNIAGVDLIKSSPIEKDFQSESNGADDNLDLLRLNFKRRIRDQYEDFVAVVADDSRHDVRGGHMRQQTMAPDSDVTSGSSHLVAHHSGHHVNPHLGFLAQRLLQLQKKSGQKRNS